jgi:hypothetical protein
VIRTWFALSNPDVTANLQAEAQEEKVYHRWRDGAGRQRRLHQGREKTSSAIQIVHDDHDHGATLSGLLNSIDGLWSLCGSERIVVLTTNNVE